MDGLPDSDRQAVALVRRLAAERGMPLCLDRVAGRTWVATADGSLVELGAGPADQ